MRDLYRSYMREFGFSLMFGILAVIAVVAALSIFTGPKQQTIQFAQNEVQFTAPVTEDTPGPVITDSGVPDREIARTSPLADRDR